MAENNNNYVATVGVQAVAEQGNLIAEFRQILENTSKALAKDGAVTIHSDTSAATAEVQKFIKDTTALLEKGLGNVDLGKLAKDFASQMSSVQGEIKGVSEQMSHLNRLMEGFGAGVSKNLGELEKRTESTRTAVAKLQQQSQKVAQSTDAQNKSEKELQATLTESRKKAKEYTDELRKLDDRKEQSKAAKNALSTIDESKRLEALKTQWAEMQKLQKNIDQGGITSSSGSVTRYSEEGLERTKNRLNEIKKTIIDLQQSLAGVDFSKLGMKDITGEDEALREQFIAYRKSIEEKEQKYLNIVKDVNVELEKRKGITQNTKPATEGQLSAEELKFVQETVAAKKAEAVEQERITQEVKETVAAYEAEKTSLQSLLDIQKTLSSVKDKYVEPKYSSQTAAEKALVEKAKEFYSIWSATGEKTDEQRVKMSLLATEMKTIVDQYKSADMFGKVMAKQVGNNYAFSGAYADSADYRYNETTLSAVNGQIDVSKAKLDGLHSSLVQNASAVEQITGRTVQSILGEAQAQQQVVQATQQASQSQITANNQSNVSLEEKLALLKQLKAELKFLETAEDKRISYEEKAYDAGGNNPKSEADSLKKIKMYEDLVEHIGTANAAIDGFQANYEELIITMKNGEQMRLGTGDIYDLTELKLAKNQIKDISFIPYQESMQQTASQVGATVAQVEKLEQSTVDAATKIETLEQKVTELNQKGSVNTTDEQIKQIGDQASSAAAKTEVLEQQITELGSKVNSSASGEQIQKIGDAATTATTKIEGLEQNVTELSSKLDNAVATMGALATAAQGITNANVTGTVNVGNKVPVTGANGEQLALEKTLRATYNIQQNMVKILSEINTKMVSGAKDATASYEQLRTVMAETVEAAKAMGAEEEKQAKKSASSQTKEQYAVMKKNLQEIIRLKQRLPKAGENEAATIQKQIDDLTIQVNQQQAILNSTNAINAARQNEVNILRKQAEIQDSINADLAKEAELEAKKAATKKLESSYNSVNKTLRSVGSGKLMESAESETVQKLITQFKEYDVLLATVDNDFAKLSNDQQNEIQESIEAFNKLTQAQKDAFKAGAYNTYNKSGTYKGYLTDLNQNSSLSGLKDQVTSGSITRQAALEQVAASIAKAKIETVDYNEATGQLTARFKDQQKNLQEIKIAFQDVGNATRHNTSVVQEYQSAASKMFSGIGSKLKELLRYFSAFTIVMRVINSIKEGVEVVREMNTALTEMKLVTESTTAEMAKAEKQIQQVAAAVGSTNVDIAQSATDWAKLGYSMSDALELAGTSAKYAKVGFTDVATASENLTATLQAFYSKELSQELVDAGDLADSITDKFVLVGNKFASSAEGLGQGMTEAGSALVAANNSLDESLALITAGTTVLQDENETANAIRTISLRLRGTKASELEDLGETDLTGVIEDASKLYKVVKEMTTVNGKEGVEIFNPDTQAYRSTYEIMLDISKVWDEMTDVQRAGLLETLAGKTRANAAAAILSNGEILESAYETSVNAAGAADKAMEETMTSIESRITLFKQATETMWQNTISSDLIKGIVDFGTEIVKLTDKVGLLSVALAGVFGYFGAKGQGRHTNQGVSTKYA